MSMAIATKEFLINNIKINQFILPGMGEGGGGGGGQVWCCVSAHLLV